jgi:AraC family transcriptional regulator
MDNYLLGIIKRTTEYIEDHLLEELDLDNISENVNMSKFHLLRVWKGATSTGLMEYVRRRRIAQSLGDLINNRNSIEFISSKYSFGWERTYNRVFKDEFDTTPAKWRRNPSPLIILDRFNADFMNCSGEGLVFFKSITVLPAFMIAGIEYKVDMEENRRELTSNRLGVDFFYHKRPEVINPVDKDIYIGFTTIPKKSGSFTYYQPSVKIDQNSILAPNMKVRQVKPHKYGVFTYMGPHRPEEISAEKLGGLWQFVADTWMPTVDFNLTEHFRFEMVNYAKCNKQYCECELYYPISAL